MWRTRTIVLATVFAALGPVVSSATQTEIPIVYFATNDGDTDLFVTTPDGAPRLLIDEPGHDCGPAASVRGELAFLSARQGASYEPGKILFDLYLQRGPEEEPIRLTDATITASGPSWSPDGEWIVYGIDGEIWKVRVSEEPFEYVQLTQYFDADDASVFIDFMPSFSSDGSAIIYSNPSAMGRDDVWIMDADGSNKKLLIEHATEATMHPDGRKIAFTTASEDAGGQTDIEIVDFDADARTVANRRVLVGGPEAELLPKYGPDGALAFVRDADGASLPFPVRLPTGHTPDVWIGGPAPPQVWVLGESTARTSDPIGASSPTFAPYPGWWGEKG